MRRARPVQEGQAHGRDALRVFVKVIGQAGVAHLFQPGDQRVHVARHVGPGPFAANLPAGLVLGQDRQAGTAVGGTADREGLAHR